MKKRLLSLLIALAFVVCDTSSAAAYTRQVTDEAGLQTVADIIEVADPADETLVVDESPAEDLLTDKDSVTGTDVLEDESLDETGDDEPAQDKDGAEPVEYATGYRRPPNYEPVASIYDGEEGRDRAVLDTDYINPNLSPLRDQNPYGTCWAFAAMGLAEMNLRQNKIQTNPDLSELHLAYFAYNSVADPLGGTAGDQTTPKKSQDILDIGGDFYQAANTMAQWIGAADEKKAPYTDPGRSDVNDGEPLEEELAFDDSAHIEDMYVINIHQDPEAVKEAIKKYGGVGICFRAENGTAAETSESIYREDTNSYYNPEHLGANHAVMVVGWDDDYDRYRFNRDPGSNGAWLVRNSWQSGSDKKDDDDYSGYFWMSYKEGTLEDNAYVFVMSDKENYDNNYQYDGGIYNAWINSVRKAANIFTVNEDNDKNEELRAVSFSSKSVNVNYTVKIYKDVADNNPESGDLVCTQSGRTTYAGFHTIRLDKPVEMSPGTKFSVVFYLNGASIDFEYATDRDDVNTQVAAKPGQSFVDGEAWPGNNSKCGNVRIKAFTCDVEPPIPPTSLTLTCSGISNLETQGITLDKDGRAMVSYTVGPDGATDKSVIMTSSNEGVAKPRLLAHSEQLGQGSFMIDAVGKGTATITAKTRLGDVNRSFTVKVENAITGIKIIKPQDVSFIRGGTYNLSLTAIPEGSEMDTNKIVWTSPDTDKVQLLGKGDKAEVKVKKAGTVKVKATYPASSGTKEDTCDLKCLPYAPQVSVTVNDGKATVKWDATEGAEKYLVKRETKDGKDVLVEEVSFEAGKKSYSVTDENTPENEDSVKYKVEAYEGSLYSYGSATAYFQSAYTITYKPGSGSNDPRNPEKIAKDETINLYPPIAPEGYTTQGWYEDKAKKITGKLPVDEDKYRNFTLTGKYTANTYTVRYLANEGEGEDMDDSAFTYDKEGTLRANSYTLEDCKFLGWNTESDGSGTFYADKAKVKNLTSVNGAVVNLYAQWGGEEQLEITLDAGEGMIISGKRPVSQVTISVAKGGKYMNLPTPELKGNSFDGWYIDPEDDSTRVSNGDPVDESKFGEERVLYARYTPITSTVYFYDINYIGEDEFEYVCIEELKVEYGSDYNKFGGTHWTMPEDVKKGKFVGWFLDEDSLEKVTENTPVEIDEDHCLFATYYKKPKVVLEDKDITIDADKIEISEGKDVYPEGAGVIIDPDPTSSVIYYTLDGTDPKAEDNENVYVYTGPFRLYKERDPEVYDDYDLTIKAYAVNKGYEDSGIAEMPIKVRPIERVKAEGMSDEDFAEYGTKGYPAGLWVAGLNASGYPYEGKAITPEVRVYDGRTLLKAGTDYTLKYGNNVKVYTDAAFETAGAPTVTVKCKGNYKGGCTAKFMIVPLEMTEGMKGNGLTVFDVTLADNGEVQKGIPQISYKFADGRTVFLKAGSDYTCTYPKTDSEEADYDPNAFKAAADTPYKGRVIFAGNYTGEVDFDEFITEKTPISAAKLGKIKDQDCTGNPVEPEVTLTYNGEILTKGTDYEVSYDSNIGQGTATVIIKGKGNYLGTMTGSFKLKGRPIKKCSIEGFKKSIAYTGSPVSQNAIKLTYKGTELKQDDDYTVEYSKNVNKGKATVIFRGKPERGVTGTLKKTFKITPFIYDPDDEVQLLSINTIYDYDYDDEDNPPYEYYSEDKDPVVPYMKGGARPDIQIKFTTSEGEVELTDGKDYKLTCKNNKTVNGKKDPIVKITFKGNYKGTASRYFFIEEAYLDDLELVASDKVHVNKAGKYKTSFAIYDFDGKKLKAGKDYNKNVTYEYADDIWLNEDDEENKEFRACGTPVQPGDIPPVGTVIMITAQGKGAYKGELYGIYRIVEANISSAKVGKIAPKSYNGEAVTLDFDDISLKIKGQKLGAGDFVIDETSYKKNDKRGTASVTLRGVGNYGGSKTIKFKIVTKKTQ